jgi:hypothetical protein
MAAETEGVKHDFERVPKFDALRDWITKLESWSEGIVGALHDAKTRCAELEGFLEDERKKVADLEDDADDARTMREAVEDFERGILTKDEMFEKVGVRT